MFCSGVLTTVIVGTLVSFVWPQKLSPQKQLIAYACTYSGLDTPLPRVPTHDTAVKDLPPLINETK